MSLVAPTTVEEALDQANEHGGVREARFIRTGWGSRDVILTYNDDTSVRVSGSMHGKPGYAMLDKLRIPFPKSEDFTIDSPTVQVRDADDPPTELEQSHAAARYDEAVREAGVGVIHQPFGTYRVFVFWVGGIAAGIWLSHAHEIPAWLATVASVFIISIPVYDIVHRVMRWMTTKNDQEES